MPLIAAGAIAAAGALGGAALSSHAAGKAASTQSNAALTAAQLQHDSAQQALNFQKQQYNTSQQEFAPWLQSGQSGLANLNYLLGIGPNPTAMPSTSAMTGIGSGTSVPPTTPARPTPGVQMGPGDLTRGVPAGTNPTSLQALTGQGAVPQGYAGQSFNGLVNSGDPNVSPNQQTTAQWKAQGIPFQNITTSDGRTVAVRTGQAGPQASQAPATGIQPNSASLINPELGAYGSLSKGWDQTFQAPTNVTEQNDPGYQFRIQQATDALQRSAAAKGGLLTGGTARDLNDYIQNQASNEYGNVYNRALNTYGTNYNTFTQDQTSKYNRLAALAGIGQQTAGQLSTLGQNNANNVGNILLTSGAQQGQALNNAAAATASGYVGGANAWGGALNGVGGNFSNLASIYSLLNQGGGASPTTGGA